MKICIELDKETKKDGTRTEKEDLEDTFEVSVHRKTSPNRRQYSF